MALIDSVMFYLPDGYEDSEETFDSYLVPMGMFVVWAGKRGLLADSCFEGGNNFVDEVAAGELSCRDVTDFEFDGKLYDYHFSERGLPFAENYYKTGKPLVRKGGLMIFDNALWDGMVLNPQDEQTKAIDATNKLAQEDSEIFNQILPIRDGLLICRKLV